MSKNSQLYIQVNNSFTLDAGWWEEISEGNESWLQIYPPNIPLFEQILAYLRSFATPQEPIFDIAIEATATTAICLRWGTYLAVLMDRNKPLWAVAANKQQRNVISRISDQEMARINIEASAALEKWIEIIRSKKGEYYGLVRVAQQLLPMPRWSLKSGDENDRRVRQLLGGLASLEVAKLFQNDGHTPEGVERIQREVAENPTRVLANALINASFRNGPIEDIHAGHWVPYPLNVSRVTVAEERMILREASYRISGGLYGIFSMLEEQSSRSWNEQVTPYHRAHLFGITPSGWSLHEQSRQIRLYKE